MRKLIIGGVLAASLIVPTAAMASPAPTPGQDSCFGQGRAWAVSQGWDASAPGHSEMGKAASQRAATNPEVNAAWIAANCA